MQMYEGHKDSSKPWETFYQRYLFQTSRQLSHIFLSRFHFGEAVRFLLVEGVHWMYVYALGIQSPSENGNGTKIPWWGCDYTPQSSSDKVIGSLGISIYSLDIPYTQMTFYFSRSTHLNKAPLTPTKKKTPLAPFFRFNFQDPETGTLEGKEVGIDKQPTIHPCDDQILFSQTCGVFLGGLWKVGMRKILVPKVF